MPHFSRDYWWNAGDTMKVAMEPTRKGLGQSLAANGADERVVCLGLDISGSITISDFHAGKPERAARWFSLGIAEQSATAAAAGMAREGKLPVVGSYATFSAARNLDQIRVSVCYSNLNVLIVGAHAGVSVGPDGATHQALEDLFAMMGLPNMAVVVPCDVIEARKAATHLLLAHQGPKYHPLRARERLRWLPPKRRTLLVQQSEPHPAFVMKRAVHFSTLSRPASTRNAAMRARTSPSSPAGPKSRRPCARPGS